MFGDRMVDIALAFAVLELDGTPTEVGLVLAARTLPLVACLLLGGVVADRVSRRAVMVISDLARLMSQGLLAALVIGGAAEVWSIAVLAGITGAAGGFFNPAATGILPGLVAPEQLQQANGIRAVVYSAGEIGGPLLAGVLVAVVGPGWALAVDAVTFGVSAAFLVRLRMPAAVARAPTSFLADLRYGWVTFRAYTWVWTFVAWAALDNLLWGAWNVLGPVVADSELGGAAVWGAILAALGIGALIGALVSIRWVFRRPMRAVAWTAFVGVPPLALLAIGAPPVLVGAGAVTMGFGMMFGNTIWEATLQRHIPLDSLSRVSAYDWFGSFAFQPLGLAIWGPIAAVMGIEPALWLAAVLMAVTGAALLAVPDIRRLESIPAR